MPEDVAQAIGKMQVSPGGAINRHRRNTGPLHCGGNCAASGRDDVVFCSSVHTNCPSRPASDARHLDRSAAQKPLYFQPDLTRPSIRAWV